MSPTLCVTLQDSAQLYMFFLETKIQVKPFIHWKTRESSTSVSTYADVRIQASAAAKYIHVLILGHYSCFALNFFKTKPIDKRMNFPLYGIFWKLYLNVKCIWYNSREEKEVMSALFEKIIEFKLPQNIEIEDPKYWIHPIRTYVCVHFAYFS